jgi:hypothetical protein
VQPLTLNQLSHAFHLSLSNQSIIYQLAMRCGQPIELLNSGCCTKNNLINIQFLSNSAYLPKVGHSITQSLNHSITHPITSAFAAGRSINQPTNQSINQSINQPTNQPINQPINQSTNLFLTSPYLLLNINPR